MKSIVFLAFFACTLTALRAWDSFLTFHILSTREGFKEINPFVNFDSFQHIFFSPLPFLVCVASIIAVCIGVYLSKHNMASSNKATSPKHFKIASQAMSFGFIGCFVLSLAVLNNSLILYYDYAIINVQNLSYIRDNFVWFLLILLPILRLIDTAFVSISRKIILRLIQD